MALAVQPTHAELSINVMAPLTIGDIDRPFDPANEAEWQRFQDQLTELKRRGVQAVSTDIWWGAVEAQENQYRWDYYDRLVEVIERVGLKWVPILSFHQLGGNIGDSGYRPIPDWVWTKHIGSPGVTHEDSLKYKSEQGNYNSESVSVWGTKYVLGDYQRFLLNFMNHFKNKAHLITELNISLGPAGELRYPSYNSHDSTLYPGRGVLQAYSDLAIESFQAYVQKKYGTIENVNKAWGFNLADFSKVHPPNPNMVDTFLHTNVEHRTPFGVDFFDWYNHSLLEHGRMVLTMTTDMMDSKESPFRGVDLGAKIPGVHWRVSSDRLAELTAGLIRSGHSNWHSPEVSYGYQEILQMFKGVESQSQSSRFVLHFTALEMNNGHDAKMNAQSEAKSLVFWIGESATKMGITIKGENALGHELYNPQAWHNMKDALLWGGYSGITLLRVGDAIFSEAATQGLAQLIEMGPRTQVRCSQAYSASR